MADAVAFPVIPTLDEADSDTGSTLDTRMTIFSDHGGLIAGTESWCPGPTQ
jgi:hypothetical protein